MPRMFSFETALDYLKSGFKVTRWAWVSNGNKIFIAIQNPDENSMMTVPYIFMVKQIDGDTSVSPIDLNSESILAEDWMLSEQ